MKKLITLSVIFVLTSIVLMSCKSSSILKRRYNKGFYVHHAAKHSEPKVADNNSHKNVSLKTPETVEHIKAAPANKPASVTAQKSEAAPLTAGAESKTARKGNTLKASPLNHPVKVIPTAFSKKKQLQLINDLRAKAKSGDAADEALSLLWILILVLLILYLLGFAFNDYGVGGAIHILAVVIVVLLILWLLRIL